MAYEVYRARHTYDNHDNAYCAACGERLTGDYRSMLQLRDKGMWARECSACGVETWYNVDYEETMTNEQKQKLAKLAKDALEIQDACNLSGVVHAFSRVMTELREILESEPDFSTEKLNTHPIAVLYSSKIASLTYSESGVVFSKAYDACYDMVGRF